MRALEGRQSGSLNLSFLVLDYRRPVPSSTGWKRPVSRKASTCCTTCFSMSNSVWDWSTTRKSRISSNCARSQADPAVIRFGHAPGLQENRVEAGAGARDNADFQIHGGELRRQTVRLRFPVDGPRAPAPGTRSRRPNRSTNSLPWLGGPSITMRLPAGRSRSCRYWRTNMPPSEWATK